MTPGDSRTSPGRVGDGPQAPRRPHEGEYPLGVKISKDQMKALRLSRDEFHGDWNYTLSPRGLV